MIFTTNEITFRLNNLNTEHRRLAYQTSAQRKIDNGSEDTNLYARELHLEDKLANLSEVKVQIEKTVAQNLSSDTAVNNIKKHFDQILSELTKANTDTQSDSNRKIIAVKLKGVKETLYDLVNTKTEGDYVFAGMDSTKQAFVKDADGKITYNGDVRARKILVEEGSYRKRGINGLELMMYPVSTATKTQPNLQFKESQRIIDQNGEEWKLDATKTNIVRYDFEGKPTTDTKPVTNNGLVPPTYTVNVGTADGTKFEARRNIFEVLDNAINALSKVDSAGNAISTADAKAELSKSIGDLRASHDTIIEAHSKLGSRNDIFNISNERISAKHTQINILALKTSGVDLAKVAIETKALEVTYTAMYSIINKTNQLSLVNFIK